jgi:DNA-binding transcriptional LysR family regulator
LAISAATASGFDI